MLGGRIQPLWDARHYVRPSGKEATKTQPGDGIHLMYTKYMTLTAVYGQKGVVRILRYISAFVYWNMIGSSIDAVAPAC